MKTVPLNFNFIEITDEAETYAKEFFELCQEKFTRGEKKYGYLRGNTNFREIYEHLLFEFGELILAVDGDNWIDGVKIVHDAIIKRLEREDDRNIPSELADVTNIPVLAYVCGRIQGTLHKR